VISEHLVDVLNSSGVVLHTFPITLGESGRAAKDADYEAKALAAAAHEQLVSDAELGTLTARIHVGRGGQMAPYGDGLDLNSETKTGLERMVRERARSLWEQEGRPEGRSEEYWHRALDERLRERAYVLRQQEGSPEGRADEYWRRVRDFEAF
jgi:hypothetical protein